MSSVFYVRYCLSWMCCGFLVFVKFSVAIYSKPPVGTLPARKGVKVGRGYRWHSRVPAWGNRIRSEVNYLQVPTLSPRKKNPVPRGRVSQLGWMAQFCFVVWSREHDIFKHSHPQHLFPRFSVPSCNSTVRWWHGSTHEEKISIVFTAPILLLQSLHDYTKSFFTWSICATLSDSEPIRVWHIVPWSYYADASCAVDKDKCGRGMLYPVTVVATTRVSVETWHGVLPVWSHIEIHFILSAVSEFKCLRWVPYSNFLNLSGGKVLLCSFNIALRVFWLRKEYFSVFFGVLFI